MYAEGVPRLKSADASYCSDPGDRPLGQDNADSTCVVPPRKSTARKQSSDWNRESGASGGVSGLNENELVIVGDQASQSARNENSTETG